jgi:hypothetical protein
LGGENRKGSIVEKKLRYNRGMNLIIVRNISKIEENSNNIAAVDNS